MDRAKFDFEKLQVWSEAVEFADVVLSIGDTLRDEKLSYRLAEQLSAAATSISMNIAEGRGRSSRKSYVLYLEYSRGSLYEVVTLTSFFSEEAGSLKKSICELSKKLSES